MQIIFWWIMKFLNSRIAESKKTIIALTKINAEGRHSENCQNRSQNKSNDFEQKYICLFFQNFIKRTLIIKKHNLISIQSHKTTNWYSSYFTKTKKTFIHISISLYLPWKNKTNVKRSIHLMLWINRAYFLRKNTKNKIFQNIAILPVLSWHLEITTYCLLSRNKIVA